MLRRIFLSALLAATGCAGSQDAPPVGSRLETDSDDILVMVVGTYHIAGSRSDLINPVSDSVLTERRQAELAELAASLATFAPTTVVTERVAPAGTPAPAG